jgi:hypothetical protein
MRCRLRSDEGELGEDDLSAALENLQPGETLTLSKSTFDLLFPPANGTDRDPTIDAVRLAEPRKCRVLFARRNEAYVTFRRVQELRPRSDREAS